MAFTIYHTNGESTWHITSGKKYAAVESVRSLQADGDELEHIRLTFDNVPITKGNFCTWKGDMARFIYQNLD